MREHICLIARTSPADWKITAFSTWSLSKLADHLIKQKVTAAISRETLRRILRAGKVFWKTTTTWKASTDPEFIAKMHRVLALYDTAPADGRVICVDEFGPLNLMPRKGKAWGPVRRPRRLRATYNRHGGVRHMLAALGRRPTTTSKIRSWRQTAAPRAAGHATALSTSAGESAGRSLLIGPQSHRQRFQGDPVTEPEPQGVNKREDQVLRQRITLNHQAVLSATGSG